VTKLLRQGDRIRLKVQTISGWKGDAVVVENQLSSDDVIAWRRDSDDPNGLVSIALRHEVALKPFKKSPLQSKSMTNFHNLCIRLIHAIDDDHYENQQLAIASIRLALHQEYGGFMNENEEQQLATQDTRIAPY
jgi:hypothetical protein